MPSDFKLFISLDDEDKKNNVCDIPITTGKNYYNGWPIKSMGKQKKKKGKHMWINNLIANKFIKSDELDKYINDGWVKGRVKKNENNRPMQENTQ